MKSEKMKHNISTHELLKRLTMKRGVSEVLTLLHRVLNITAAKQLGIAQALSAQLLISTVRSAVHVRVKQLLMLLFAAVLFVAVGCGEKRAEGQADSGSDVVTLAKVNNTVISQGELDLAVQEMLESNSALSVLSEQPLRDKLLQSLINSRAMALLAEQELSTAQRQLIELKTRAYREKLLVNHYLQQQAVAEKVSTAMIQQYYNKHPQEFSGGVYKTFELLSTTVKLNDDQRRSLLVELAKLTPADNWQQVARQLKQQGYPLKYQQSTINVALLDEPIKTLVMQTAVNQQSPVKMHEQRLLRVNVIAEKKHPAKPLAQVSGEIRKKLSALQLKQAVKKTSEQALTQVNVTQ